MYKDKRIFKDIKNLLNYKTFTKLQKAITENKRIYFVRIVNGKRYNYKVTTDRYNNVGVIIRNLTDFSAYTMLIGKDTFKDDYNDVIQAYNNIWMEA